MENETEVSETPLPDPEVPEDGAAGCVSVREPWRHSIAFVGQEKESDEEAGSRKEGESAEEAGYTPNRPRVQGQPPPPPTQMSDGNFAW